MATPQPDPPAASDEPSSTVVVALGAFVIGIFIRVLADRLRLNSTIAALLPFLAGAAAFAGAAAAGMWQPRWLGDRSKPVTWVALRIVIVAFAIVTIAGVSARSDDGGCAPTYRGDIGSPGGKLLYSTLVGDTLVCTYDYRGGL